MHSLKPSLEIVPQQCPHCAATLAVVGYLIPGMRNLADLECSQCGPFFGDLPAGQGLYTPVLLEKKTGLVFGSQSAPWFGDWLAESFSNRTDEPVGLETRVFSPGGERVILLNCLDALYGHSLLKLLNAERNITAHPELGLIAIVPRCMAWMLPDGLAEAWIVDLPLGRGTQWNDWLAGEFAKRIGAFSEVYLSEAVSHPHPTAFDIQNFTRVQPFPLGQTEKGENPVVTFIYREDRVWASRETRNAGPLTTLFTRSTRNGTDISRQLNNLIEFAVVLRQAYSYLDFAVVGFGEPGGLPDWILDMRRPGLGTEEERSWCRRYAASHLVVGVHGSNMLLPSAHARSVIDIIGPDRYGNVLQDLVVRGSDARDALFRYRHVSSDITPGDLAKLSLTVLRYDEFQTLMPPNS